MKMPVISSLGQVRSRQLSFPGYLGMPANGRARLILPPSGNLAAAGDKAKHLGFKTSAERIADRIFVLPAGGDGAGRLFLCFDVVVPL